jgi:hypothetical protein
VLLRCKQHGTEIAQVRLHQLPAKTGKSRRLLKKCFLCASHYVNLDVRTRYVKKSRGETARPQVCDRFFLFLRPRSFSYGEVNGGRAIYRTRINALCFADAPLCMCARTPKVQSPAFNRKTFCFANGVLIVRFAKWLFDFSPKGILDLCSHLKYVLRQNLCIKET